MNGKPAGWQGSLQGVIGGRPGPSSSYMYYFKGALDDVRVYGRAITAAEVSAIYTSPNTSVNPISPVNFDVFPNPVISGSAIQLRSKPMPLETVVRLYSSAGKLILTSPYSESIEIPSLAAGVYILQVQNQEGSATKKLIIQD
ncbi:MAG: T9SS type A sorting domain-containing protein [Bacteroidetes bacterium]|nr:T9SS type A sorting domain-containing protein [Bacteroidota bacterium]